MAGNRTMRLRPPSIQEFEARFATEDDCHRFLFAQRWPKGWSCPRCGNDKCYPIQSRGLHECAACGYQVSVTAGTVLHKTRTPLRTWFLAIFLMATDKRGISSVGLANRLGISQKKAWYMLHKLRRAMAVRNGRYKLDGLVELDESFFGEPREGGRIVRGARKMKVLAGLSRDARGRPRHLRLIVLPRMDRAHLEPAVAGMVASNAAIETDRLRCYAGLGAGGYRHHAIAKPERDERSWLRTALSNARALIGGTHHGLGADGRHLQAYLDEFAYRFNRRHRPDTIFDHCVAAVAACPPWTWREITGGVGFAKKAQPRAA